MNDIAGRLRPPAFSPNGAQAPITFDQEPGRRPQIGGGLAAFIGIVWLVGVKPAPPGALVDAHKIAWAFLVVGILGLVAGTLAVGSISSRAPCTPE